MNVWKDAERSGPRGDAEREGMWHSLREGAGAHGSGCESRSEWEGTGVYGCVRECAGVYVRYKRLQRARESVRGCDCKGEEKKKVGGEVSKKKGDN